MVTAKHFESGDDVDARRTAHQHRRFGRAGRPRQWPRATQERRGDPRRARKRSSFKAIPPNRPSTRRSPRAIPPPRRSSARAPSSPRRRSEAPFAGRLGLRNVDIGQYVAVGTSLVTLQQLDPIYADFPVPEEALNALATGQAVRMTVDAIPGRSFEGKVEAIDARVSAEFAKRHRPRRVRQSRPQAPARHVRQSDRHDRRTGGGADASAHRDRL